MSDNSSSSGDGIGLLGLLGVVFVTLKLLGKIAWSWWWVTLPFWGGAALLVAMIVAMIVVVLAVSGAGVLRRHITRASR